MSDIILSLAKIPANARNLGPVTGSCVIGNIFSILFSSECVPFVAYLFGSNSGAFSKRVKKVIHTDFDQIAENARKIGANAVYDIHIDDLCAKPGLMVFSVSGTATME